MVENTDGHDIIDFSKGIDKIPMFQKYNIKHVINIKNNLQGFINKVPLNKIYKMLFNF